MRRGRPQDDVPRGCAGTRSSTAGLVSWSRVEARHPTNAPPVPEGRSCVSFPPLARTATRIPRSPVHSLTELFESNRAWAARITAQEPDFFERLSHQQNPEFLWIGCADSRVPANEIV